jgi:hypothetical protein
MALPLAKKKNPAAVALGRLGSKKTDKPKGLAKLSPAAREAIRAKGLATRRAKKLKDSENNSYFSISASSKLTSEPGRVPGIMARTPVITQRQMSVIWFNTQALRRELNRIIRCARANHGNIDMQEGPLRLDGGAVALAATALSELVKGRPAPLKKRAA